MTWAANWPRRTSHPSLQLPGGVCHSFDVWLPSEAHCLDYIRRHIIGATLKEEL